MKRAVDLSLRELSALGARAARGAVGASLDAGLPVTGTIDMFQEEQAVSTLAQLHPSGTITIVAGDGEGPLIEAAPSPEQEARVPIRRSRFDS